MSTLLARIHEPSHSRRRFLATALALGAAGLPRWAVGQDPTSGDAEAARRQLDAAGLGPIRERTSPTYLVLGDAPEAFLDAALSLCDGLARDFLDHFTRRQFEVHRPEGRLTVVALSGPEAFAAYLGSPQEGAYGGHYDLATNRLVMFDNRGRADAGPRVERANTVALMHEAAHQLTYNTGLLQRGSDVPLAINEGLGTYAESRTPDGRIPIGRPNEGRLLVLVDADRRGRAWLPAADLIADDALWSNPEVDLVQQAYAQGWLLVYHLLQDRARAAQFREYLAGLSRPQADRRTSATTAFGDLDRLDRDLRSAYRRLVRR